MDNQPINPIQNMLMTMPALPDIIRGAMPVPMRQMEYDDNPIGMIFSNFKKARIEKSTALDASIAANADRALQSKMNAINTIITFSAKIDCELAEYQHKKTMFGLEAEEKKMDIYIKQSQATQAGFEAKLSELDFKIREAQFKKMMGGE